jgi:hypothetical protein
MTLILFSVNHSGAVMLESLDRNCCLDGERRCSFFGDTPLGASYGFKLALAKETGDLRGEYKETLDGFK